MEGGPPYSAALGFANRSLLDSMLPESGPPNFRCVGIDRNPGQPWDRLNAAIYRCLPGAMRLDIDRAGHPHGRHAAFRIGRVEIHSRESSSANRHDLHVGITFEAAGN